MVKKSIALLNLAAIPKRCEIGSYLDCIEAVKSVLVVGNSGARTFSGLTGFDC
jgi:hypothetical protein